MFDISRLTESASELIGGGAVQDLLSRTELIAAVTGNGRSLQDLQGLDADHLIGLLHSQGVDVSALAPEQLQQLIEVTSKGGLADFWKRT